MEKWVKGSIGYGEVLHNSFFFAVYLLAENSNNRIYKKDVQLRSFKNVFKMKFIFYVSSDHSTAWALKIVKVTHSITNSIFLVKLKLGIMNV